MNGFEALKDQKLLRATEVARVLDISRSLAYRLMRTGEIPVIKISHAVRVKPSDLKEYVKRCRKSEFAG